MVSYYETVLDVNSEFLITTTWVVISIQKMGQFTLLGMWTMKGKSRNHMPKFMIQYLKHAAE
jgi:hypothetical protein